MLSNPSISAQQLVQSLLSFIIASQLVVTAFSDRINLVNKNDTGRHLLCLLEEVPHTGRTHAYIHFYKCRTA